MTQWFYSNAQRERLGPVDADDLALLHRNGQIGADTLVWREGYADWKPWREAIGEVVPDVSPAQPAASMFDAPATSATQSTFATAGPDAPAYADANPYRIAEPLSPYAPPKAQLRDDENYVAGGRVVYAGFWKRVSANIIDSFVTTAASYAIQIPLMMVMGVMGAVGGGEDPFSSGAGIALILVIYVVSIGIPLAYFSWMHSSPYQASLGKMAIGIKVVRSDGHRISFWRAFGRWWALIPSGIILAIGYIMAGFTDRKRALHDMMCDTLVVDKYAYTAQAELQREELGVVTIVVLCLVGLLFLAMIALFAVMGFALFGSGALR
jgi:uncharacterized RDD family membrane protein YckC